MWLGALPHAALLKTLATFTADKGSTPKPDDAGDQGPSKDGPLAANVLVPGFLALPKKLTVRLFADEYINFTELSPAKGRCRPPAHELDGKVVLIQATDLMATKKVIPDLATWVQSFAMYTAAITRARARYDGLHGLHCQMQHEVLLASSDGLRPNFREQAADKGTALWARADPSLTHRSSPLAWP